MTPLFGWQATKNEEYLKLIRHRIENVDHAWALQFLKTISKNCKFPLTLKDVGCQCFQFYKQIKKQGLPIQYFGYDLDEKYVQIGLEYFPELNGRITLGDFTEIKDVRKTDVSVCSATIEHVLNWKQFMKQLLLSTNHLIIIRTFLSQETKSISVRDTGAEMDSLIWEFGFTEICDIFSEFNWDPQIVRDEFSDSLPIYKSVGLNKTGFTRTQYVIVAKPKTIA